VACEDAELVLLTTATITSTSRLVIAKLREQGRKVGLCKLRLFRPFPYELVRRTLAHAPKVAVLERNVSLGREGIFCTEVKAALVNQPQGPRVQGYLAGLGGSDVGPELIERIIDDAMGRDEFSDAPIWMEE
jgi:pyruvate/2-oxoacid:ferredoxin oxidoreductase alpha subunit